MERIAKAKAEGTYNPSNPTGVYMDSNLEEGDDGEDSDTEFEVAKSSNLPSSKPKLGLSLRMSQVHRPRVSTSKPVAGAYTPIGAAKSLLATLKPVSRHTNSQP